jgi:hypothetical protein
MRKLRVCLSIASVIVLALAVVGSEAIMPKLEVLSQNVSSRVVKNHANEDDWAYVYAVLVRNTGQPGTVRAKGRITTPQGQFYREQTVTFGKDESKTVTFIYTEPDFILDLFNANAKLSYEFSYDVMR